ncbi:hypothetical protein GCM10010174_89340 [Kutzneria viridogrisea]|uniref:ABC-2 type transport system permease protein n=1 Tax=Kutzneria viridogrisea TaxID=47990 RepID=A0ABR6BR17_9PSEU|nr:hypothetical protein [Kutzneria viridogrisea]
MKTLLRNVILGEWLVGYLMVIGLLCTPFFQTDSWRHTVLGSLPAQPTAGVAVLCLALALGWRSLLRRDFVWLGPARLTWDDFGPGRVRTMNRRLLGGWALRLLVVAYVTAVTAQVHGWRPEFVPVGCALLAVTAALTLLAARRAAPAPVRWAEQAVPLLFAAAPLAVLPAWWGLTAAVTLAALVLVFVPGRSAAASAGRVDLLEGWNSRVLRQVSVAFMDVMALLPPGRPLPFPRSLSGRFVVLRFVLLGVLSRARYLTLTGLLALAVVMLPHVLPATGAVWWLGLGAFFATIPYAAALSELSRVPGLRRWLGCTDMELRVTAVCVLLVITIAWWAVTGFAFGWTLSGLLVSALAAAAVVRTVTKPMLDFDKLGEVAVPGMTVAPVGLIAQLATGLDVLVGGAAVLQFLPMSAITVLAVAGLFGFAVWRRPHE